MANAAAAAPAPGGRTFMSLLAVEPQLRTDADVDEIANELRQLMAFQSYKKKDLDDFGTVVQSEEVAAGETVFKQGDTGNDYYVIYRGSVDVLVSKTGNPADAEVVCALAEGFGFGDVAIIKSSPRNATIKTREPCVFLKVRGSTFLRVHHRNLSSEPIAVDDDEGGVALEQTQSKEELVDLSKSEDDLVPTARGLDTLNDPLREALESPPERRTPEEIMDILEEMNHLKAFAHLSTSVRRELAAVVTFEILGKAGDVLFRQGDVGTSWFVIYRGMVEVIVNGVTVCTLGEGEGFGELALINDKPRAATIVAYNDDCQFIKVDKKDYNRILKDIESNTIRLEEHGQTVMVMEKKLADAKTQGYIVMSASPEKLIQHLEEEHVIDPSFVVDFLLTYRTFLTRDELWKLLLQRFNHQPEGVPDPKAMQQKTRSRIVLVVRSWVLNHQIDYEGDHHNMGRLVQFVDQLAGAGMDADYDMILSAMESRGLDSQGRKKKNVKPDPVKDDRRTSVNSLPDKNTVSKRRNSMKQLLAKSFARLHMRTPERDLVPDAEAASAPSNAISTFQAPVDVVRVNRDDDTYKTIKVEPHMTAAEVAADATKKFQTDKTNALVGDHVLVEVKSDGSVRVFDAEETCIVSKLSLNGRLFLKPADAAKPFKPAAFTVAPVDANYHTLFLEMDTEEVARLLTLLDHELLARIDPTEYIAFIYKIKGINTSNLNTFSNRFNQMNYWVVSEVVKTRNFNKRVQLVKKFIRLAQLLRGLNNFNSCFAVLSGLGNTAVSRMLQTWRRVPQKYLQEFEELQSLMDPSRNMKTYRQLLLNSPPPLIPFFPIVMKDLFFVHECNDSKIKGLINFDKLRLLSNIIRFVDAFRYSRYDAISQPPATLKKRRSTVEAISDAVIERGYSTQKITEFLTSLQVIDDMKTLSQMSRETEKAATRHARAVSNLK